jgi:DNA-binding response OmpR family regulator
VTYQTTPHILIVDDDEAICKTLSAILQSKGYQTTTATTAKDAMAKSKTQFFNLALLDIRLPDMEGTQLLSQLQEITPETIKIMVTGYPSLKNAVEALNFGASSYIMKPIDPAELLKKIADKLETQRQAEETTKEKLAKWIQTQARKAQASDFQELLEETATELAEFGLTKNQAKIYIALVTLGVASASEIAATSRIRREEVYRLIPELEKRGIITKKLKAPRKYSATNPEPAIQILTNIKLTVMKEQVEKLDQTKEKLVSKLKAIELPVEKEDSSIEVIRQQEQGLLKLTDMINNAKQQIDAIASLEALKIAYVNRPKEPVDRVLKSVRLRIVTETCEPDAFIREIMQISEKNNQLIEFRQIEKVPFNLLIVDNEEAMWGETELKNKDTSFLWTNDPTQICILKESFESLWQKTLNSEA